MTMPYPRMILPAAVLGVVALVSGCGSPSPAPSGDPAADSGVVSLLYTARIDGEIEPCG